ncbi:winged helix-turn-helix domain-containing protein, partial [Variovorax paradoxus]|uniref:ATP-binding protein n=1 Tax=Variovorax paradoxus TaxID=34073 RepID=UPI00247A384C
MPAPPRREPVMQAAPDMSADIRWRFGAFVVWETQRRLERFGQAIRLGSRAFELLLQLIARAGEVVSSEELLAAVWSGVVVEEASVRVQMSALRKALGEPEPSDPCEEWISNIPLRGYRFNARALREEVGAASGSDADEPAFAKPPVPLTRLIGREADVERMLAALDTHRIVTVAGTGGIGKTRAALHAAQCLQQRRAVATAFVDLAPLVSQEHVLGTMARALGAPADAPDTLQAIEQRLAGRELLLLVDNCEHVLDSLPMPIAALLAALPGLRVLATSREVLRAPGECVLRLAPLAVPEAERLTLDEAMDWPAVRLLVERARDAGSGAFNAAHGSLLARISRQVDGIPLAIELVAARLGVQSLNDLALRLNDHMRLNAAGKRAVPERHRTLAATLDWSVALLNEQELRLFRRLSVFRGRFDVESALGISVGVDPDTAFDALISLANKSLVFFDHDDAVAPYRLLDTTRSYAATLLAQSDERPALLRRHATLMLELMQLATADLPQLSEQAWAERYAHRLNDVRAALEASDANMAASLVAVSAPLWYQLSEVEEYRDRISATIALIEHEPRPDQEAAAWLHTALVGALLHTGGPDRALDAACD